MGNDSERSAAELAATMLRETMMPLAATLSGLLARLEKAGRVPVESETGVTTRLAKLWERGEGEPVAEAHRATPGQFGQTGVARQTEPAGLGTVLRELGRLFEIRLSQASGAARQRHGFVVAEGRGGGEEPIDQATGPLRAGPGSGVWEALQQRVEGGRRELVTYVAGSGIGGRVGQQAVPWAHPGTTGAGHGAIGRGQGLPDGGSARQEKLLGMILAALQRQRNVVGGVN